MRLTQQHFEDLASAAWLAKDRGDDELAARFDIMARKANLECTRADLRGMPSLGSTGEGRLKWQDMPSVFDVPSHE